MIKLTDTELGRLRGVQAITVTRAGLPRTKDKKYDLEDPKVWKYATSAIVKAKVKEALGGGEGTGVDLDNELKRKNIALSEARKRKLDLDLEQKKKVLIPLEVAQSWVGHFAAGLRNNLLTLGQRISRGADIQLRNKIEKDVARAIDRTLDHASAAMDKDFKAIKVITDDEEADA